MGILLDRDLMELKLVRGGVTYFYAHENHLKHAVEHGGMSYQQMASYVLKDNQFIKNRSSGDSSIPNALLSLGREEVNKFFDMMESI